MNFTRQLPPETVSFVHDLRNHLASIRAGASMLQSSHAADPVIVAQVAEALQDQVREIVGLVDGFVGKAATEQATEHQETPASTAEPTATMTLLVADDNADSADALARFLRMQDHRVLIALDGEQALELAEAERPDMILLDISMPLRDGYSVAQEIRSRPWGRAPKLIAMSGWLSSEQLQRATQAGFDTHFNKPIDLDALERLLRG
jgi:CheY-like chemotaxis protein